MIHTDLEFEQIHETFRPKIQRYLIRLVGEQEAEDLTQEVFVKVSRALKNFRGESQLSTWIYRIATNAALDRFDSPSYQRAIQAQLAQDAIGDDEVELEDQDVWTGEKTPRLETEVMRQEMYECVWNRLEHLPANYRTVLLLSDMEGFTNNEVAEILGVSLDAVKIRLHRARARLRKDIETYCPPAEWVPDE
jgi:RNA polymerase sigma-70 factor (ECF subfamily)